MKRFASSLINIATCVGIFGFGSAAAQTTGTRDPDHTHPSPPAYATDPITFFADAALVEKYICLRVRDGNQQSLILSPDAPDFLALQFLHAKILFNDPKNIVARVFVRDMLTHAPTCMHNEAGEALLFQIISNRRSDPQLG